MYPTVGYKQNGLFVSGCLLQNKEKKSTITTKKRMRADATMDSTAALMTLPSPSMQVAINQGTPSPMQMSNTLEPMALDTAMSPSSFLATAIEPSASGTEVPIARNVMP